MQAEGSRDTASDLSNYMSDLGELGNVAGLIDHGTDTEQFELRAEAPEDDLQQVLEAFMDAGAAREAAAAVPPLKTPVEFQDCSGAKPAHGLPGAT